MKRGIHKWTYIINKLNNHVGLGIIKESVRDNKGRMFKKDAWYQMYTGECVNMTKNNNGFSKWKKGTRLDCELNLIIGTFKIY